MQSRKFAVHLLMFGSFFPYVSPISTPFSLQPYSLIFGFVVLVMTKDFQRNILPLLWMPCLVLIPALILVAFGDDILNSFRSLYNYLAFAILLPVYFYLSKKFVRELIVWVKIASFAYLLTAIIQLFFLPTFMSCCVVNIGNQISLMNSGRGVASLAPEPTFFGFIAATLLLMGVHIKSKMIVIVNLFSLLFLSVSSLATLCLLLSFSVYAIFRFNIRMIITAIVAILILAYALSNAMSETNLRLFKLIDIVSSGGYESFLGDESSLGRFYHIVQPFVSFWSGYGLPNGYNGLPNGDPRILSGIGSAIFELGVFCFPILLVLLRFTFLGVNRLKYGLLHFGFLWLTWINANQIGMPLLILYSAWLYWSAVQIATARDDRAV